MAKVSFYTLGCKVNQYETQAMEELFTMEGYEIGDWEEPCDIYVINSCTVTNMSDRKTRQSITKAKKMNDGSVIAVVGCYAQIAPEKLETMDQVDVIIGTQDRKKVVSMCREVLNQRQKLNIVKPFNQAKVFEPLHISSYKSMTRAYLKIQEGCDQYCSYCIIPYARGSIQSRPIEEIIQEVQRLAENHFSEIVITGIHVCSYGKEGSGNLRLIDVLEAISRIDIIKRIRLSSLEPSSISKEFLQRLVLAGKICDHFHLSLQSGSNSILGKMNRKYDIDFYRQRIAMIREYFPQAGITTDIIVGFPGETEIDFEETCNFVEEIQFSRIHVFKYSPRSGTPAASMSHQVDGNIKNSRSDRLLAIGDDLQRKFARQFIDQELSVLFEENSGGMAAGYSTNYIRVQTPFQSDLLNKIRKVLITGLVNDELSGIIKS